MAYLDFYTTKHSCNEAIIGTCNTMCPQQEIDMRTQVSLIHVLEVVGQQKKMVKAYSRSAADSVMAVPNLLRPYPVLKETVEYLLLEVTKRTNVPTILIYDFINDRLRSVRQDMTIQRLDPQQCTSLLDPMIRFHVYYGYKLCEYGINEYDPVLNNKNLMECLKQCLCCWDSIQKDDPVDNLTGVISKLGLENTKQIRLGQDQALIESLYILCNLDDMHPMLRYLRLPAHLKSKPNLQLAYEIAIGNLKGNYIQVCRLSLRLCSLSFYAFCLYLPRLQKHTLRVMSRAYSSARLRVPCRALRDWLLFDSDAHALAATRYYGLATDGPAVAFSQKDFNDNVVKPRKLVKLKDLQPENILC